MIKRIHVFLENFPLLSVSLNAIMNIDNFENVVIRFVPGYTAGVLVNVIHKSKWGF